MPKTVWYVSKYANILKYGGDSRQASFCRQFKKAGYDVKLITSNSSHLFKDLPKFKGRYLEESEAGIDIVWVNTLKYKRATSIGRFLSWFWFDLFVIMLPLLSKYKRPDVVICSSLSITSVLTGLFYKAICKSEFIFEVRDIWPQTLIDLKGMSKHHPVALFLRVIEKMGYKYADHIVGTMPGLHKHVSASVKNASPVHFIPQGVNLDFYRNSQMPVNPVYLDQHLPQGKFIVTYAGTLGKAYALEYVIGAARILEDKRSNVHFVFLGNGIEEENLKKLSVGCSNISFAPRVRKEEVLSVLKASDLLLHSFKMEKVFEFGISPNKFIDYMYSKIPIICMFSGYPSMLNEANCGEFIPSENTEVLVDTLLRYEKYSASKLLEMGENGHDFLVKNRNFEMLAKQYMALF